MRKFPDFLGVLKMGMGFSSEWSHCNADAEYCHCAEHNRQRSGTAPVVVHIQETPMGFRYLKPEEVRDLEAARQSDIYDVSSMD